MDPKLDHLKKVFRSLLLPEKYGATIGHFRKLYLEMEGEEIPYRRFGFNTDIELLNMMNNVVYMQLDKHGNIKIYAKESTESRHIVDFVAKQNPKRSKASNTKQRAQRLNSHQTNPSNFRSFRTPRALNPSTEYISRYQQPMANSTKPAKSGAWNQCMVSNSTTLTETGSQHQTPKSSLAKPSVNTSFESSNHKNQNDQLDGPIDDLKHHQKKTVEDKPLILFNTPDNTKAMNESHSEAESEDREVWYGDDRIPEIPQQHFEYSAVINDEANKVDIFPIDLFSISDYAVEVNKIAEPKFDLFKFIIGTKLKISVPQTFSPYKFWFHIEDEISHLDVLMENLGAFYGLSRTEPISKSKIPEKSINVGQIYAVKYLDEWHRGKILYVGSLVKIFFLDYGTVAEVCHEDLRFLDKQFTKSPAFARRGVLDRVKPTFGTWTIETLHFFENLMKLYQYSLICATITNINEEERTVYFKLTDETQIPYFDVAESLIRHNCAYSTQKSLADFQSRHLNEIRLSFDALESGQYPSIEEIFYWHKEKQFDWITFDEMRLDIKYLGYETIE